MPNPTCPKCNSTDFDELSGGSYKCQHCGYEGEKSDLISFA